ncbi:hypothetical protein [Streptomyces sp. NPDC048639]|uniref:hypothetical protein n=1 Tax=Streptomyces sp. NPDC048639 TaxID=3365581 RepID=UPI0037166AD7
MAHPNMPNQPYPPMPQAPMPGPPAPQRSWFARHKVLTAIGGIFAVSLVIGIATGGGDDGSKGSQGSGTNTTALKEKENAEPKQAAAEPAKEEQGKEEQAKEDQGTEELQQEKSQADRFREFVAKNGTPTEKAAVGHITKIQGADEQNDILDSAEVYTDFTGGLMGPHQNEGKLIASAFADWKDSENGLVTVYDQDGEILSNGQF